jgi:hypothetical protein
MEVFYTNFKALTQEQRKGKLDQILMFLRQQNAHEQAAAFQELKSCYPMFPFSKNERAFREYLAWRDIAVHQDHPLVKHVLSQG